VSFRTRLVLAAAYLVAAVVLALEIPLALSIERRADSDFQADVLSRTALLAARISDDVAAARQGGASVDTGALTEAVSSSAATPDERIVVTNEGGQVLVDSTGEAASGSKFGTAERPEFGVALEEGQVDSRRRFSDTAGEELLLVTVPVVDGPRGSPLSTAFIAAGRASRRSASPSSRAPSCSRGSSQRLCRVP
jgi:hypothetical protein